MRINPIDAWKVLCCLLFALSRSSVSAQTELISNGSFESTLTDWTSSGAVSSANGGFARSGTYFLWLGGAVSFSDSAYQTVSIPGGATAATLSFYYNINSLEGVSVANDTFSTTIRNASGTVLATVANLSNIQQTSPGSCCYTRVSYNLLPYAGQSVRIHFASTNNATLVTNFRVDDVSVLVTTSSGSPNLTPHQPPGWSDKLVVSKTTGTTTDSTGLTTADTLYVDWAVANLGTAATASTFNCVLFVDGVGRNTWVFSPPFNASTYSSITDYSIGTLSAGTHTITITTDYGGTIAESSEADNSYTKTISVTGPVVVRPTVQTLPATPVGETSATLRGEITSDGGGTILERRIEWAKSTGNWGTGVSGIDYGFFSDATTPFNVSGNAFSLALVGFASNTGYKYRVWARNSVGWSDVNAVNVVTFTTSSPCSYSLNPSSTNHGSDSGSGSFDVFTGTGCIWEAIESDSWVHTSSTGSGNGTVNYTIDASANARSGAITVGGQTFTINQSGPGAAPDARFATDNNTPQPGQTVRFYAVSPIAGNTFSWSIDDSPVKTGPDSTAYLPFNSSGTYRVKLVASDRQSRSHTQTADIYVQSSGSGTGTGGSSGNTQPVHRSDPVNLASGSYFYQHTDLKFPGIGIPFEFARHYDSKVNDTDGLPLGFGWNYTPFISVKDNTTNAIVFYGDGHSEVHANTPSGFVGDPGVFDLLFKNPDGSWLVVTKQQTTNQVNAEGQLVLIQDRNGNTITLAYEDDPAAQGRLKQITDTVGRVTHFHPYPDNSALIGRIEDVLGRSTWFTYDDRTDLVRVTNSVGKTTKFTYNALHQITDAEDNRGNPIVHNDYDAAENTVTNQVDAFGKTTRFIYDFPNHVTTQVNALGHAAVFRFDHRLLLTNVVDEAGFSTSYVYEDDDKDRNRILIQDRNGNIAHLAYDERGNVTNKLDALNQPATAAYDSRNNPIGRMDPLGNELTIGYDPQGNVRFTTNALGFVTEVTYLPNGLPEVITDARGFSVTNVWVNGNLIETIDALGNSTRMHYDAAGRRTRLIDALGRTNRFVFDDEDNLLHTVDALGQTNYIAYDANRNPISSLNPRGATSTNEFDLRDRLIKTIDPLGHTVTNLYDDIDRKVGMIDQRGNTTHFELNRIGHLLAITDALNRVTQFRRDPNGNPTNVVDEANNVTINWFDSLDRLYASVDPRGNTNLTGFDALSRVITTTNASGQVTRYLYDALSRLTNVVDAFGGNVFFDYDKTDKRIRTTDPRGNVWTNKFDPLGRLFEQINPHGQKTVLQYDAVGNVTNRITPNGVAIAFQHDALNRLTNIVYPDGTTVALAYDEVGNWTSMVDSVGTTIRSFDLLNRPLSVSDPFGQVVSNRFDAAGNRIVLRYPDGKEVSYGYDALNRMESLTNWLGGEVHYSRDARGLVTHAVNANGTTVDMAYDATGRMTTITNWSLTASVIASETVLLDALGNQTNLTGLKALVPILQGTNVNYLYDADNRLISVNGKTVTHDNNGNLIGLGTDSYRFDFENRLLSYAVGGVFGGQQRYDGLGDRLQHTTNGVARRFVLDRLGSLSQVLAETDGGGSITAFYVYGLGLAQRITPDGQTDTYHFDLRGSTVLLTSATGEQVAAYAYDSFGALADSDEDRPQPFRYLGRYGILDDGNGLYHARARYFNPHLGRFISQDPLWGNDSSSQSFNRYAYALNNPLRYLDATGLTSTEGNVNQWQAGTAESESSDPFWDAFWPAFRNALLANGVLGGLVIIDVVTLPDGIGPETAAGVVLRKEILNSSVKTTVVKALPGGATEQTVKHHIFNKFRGNSPASQKYRKFFEEHGITPDKFTVEIPQSLHKDWIHKAGQNWTTMWKRWIDANPNATTREVYQQAGRIMDDYGLNRLPIVPYK